MKDNLILSFGKLCFIGIILFISPFAEGKIIKVNKRVFANKNTPPAPHNATQHSSQRQIRNKLIDFSLIFLLFSKRLKLLSKLFES